MDRQLLAALDNLSDALYQIADALDKKDAKTATGEALQSGQFGKQIQEIQSGIISIKEDTAKILDNQETILKILNSKKKEEPKKVTKVPKGETTVEVGKEKSKELETMDSVGGDKSMMSNIAKGVGIILLLAVAVLAIGMAFKLVGNIDILSVIGLALGITIISIAFAEVAKLDLSINQAFNTSVALVFIAGAITISSLIMSFIKPVSPTQFLTAIFIAATFAAMSVYLDKIFIATGIFSKLRISKLALFLTLTSISAAITASSFIMSFIKPIGLSQGITAILIASVFAAIGFNLHKIGISVALFQTLNISTVVLVKTLVGIAAAITASSYVLSFIQPLTFDKGITAILISALFLIISFNMEKIAMGVIAFNKTGVKASDLLLVMVGIATAITASSWILSFVMPIGLWQFVTALGVTILFAIMSYVLPELAVGVAIVAKYLGEKNVRWIPIVLVAISAAIMLSSHILALTESIKFSKLLEILALGATLAVVSLLLTPAIIFLGRQDKKALIQGGIAVVIIAIAIMVTSHILSIGNYEKYPSKDWIMGTSVSILVFGLATIGLGFAIMGSGGLGFAGIALGAVAVIMVAATILATSHILAFGNYEKYPPLDWILGVAGSMVPFAMASVLLGPLLPLVALGALSIYLVAKTIVETAKILSEGTYEKYPSFDWSKGVGLSLAAFSAGMVMLGGIIFGTFGVGGLLLAAGALAILGVAGTIVAVSDILANGYEIDGKKFTPNWKGGPTKEWAESVAIALGAFSPLYTMLQKNAIFSLFGMGGVGPSDYAKAIKTVTEGIVTAATELNKGDSIWKGGPSKKWAEGVALALGAFSPIYEILVANSGWWKSGVSVEDFSTAIKTISMGIIDAANFFSSDDAITSFKNPPPEEWARGVGKAIAAFSPIYEVLSNSKGIFSSGPSIGEMRRAIISISKGIIEAAIIFGESVAVFDPNKAPSVEWSMGVSKSIEAFAPIFEYLSNNSGWFGASIKDLNSAIISISNSIVSVSNVLKDGDYSYEISNNWIKSIDKLYKNYINIVSEVSKIEKELKNGNSLITNIAITILKIDRILSRGKYQKFPNDEWINTTNSVIIRYADLLIKINDEYTSENLGAGIIKTIMILSLISRVDREFEKGKYQKYPDKSWIDNSKSAIDEIAQLAVDIDAKYDLINLKIGLYKVRSIADTIQNVSLSLNKGKYEKYPSVDWARGSSSAISEFMNLDLGNVFSQSFDFIFGSDEDSKKAELGRIVDLMLYVDEKFQKGDWNKFPTVSWAEGAILAIQKFRSMITMLSFGSIGDKIFSFFGTKKDPLKEAVSNIELLANAFDKLGNSFQSFSNSLEGLDAEKLAAIKTLSSNVILMSLMDPEQFDKMMDALEERSGVFGELIKGMDSSRRESTGGVSVNTATSTASIDSTKILADKLDVVAALLTDITSVVGSRGALKKYLASIKDDVSI
jgi:hypothetical protein